MSDKRILNIAVIGAGPAGVCAAIAAAKNGAAVTVFEKNDQIGRKLLMTGNGRCNLTNELLRDGFLAEYYNGSVREIAAKAYQRFGYKETEEFFLQTGIPFRKRDTLIYPYSDQAVSVQRALLLELMRYKIRLRYGIKVTHIESAEDKYCLTLGVLSDGSMKKESFDRVILAPGSRCMPDTGSDNFAYKLLKKLSINYIKPLPSLTKLKCTMGALESAAGDRWQGGLALYEGANEIASEKGEIQFLKDSISGIVAFQLSGPAGRAIDENREIYIAVDLFPETEPLELLGILKDRFKSFEDRNAVDVLCGFLKERLAAAYLSLAGIEPAQRAAEVADKKIEGLAVLLKSHRLLIKETGSFNECQTCSGGIIADELSDTFEIKKYKGMYAAGEIIDIDGKCGGFNLQFAVTSGMIAGESAAGI